MPGERRRDVLRRLAGLAVCAAVLAPAAHAEPLRFGLNAVDSRPGESAEPLLDLQVSLGATVQRIGIPWRLVQPKPDSWDWTYVDTLISRASSRGMSTIAVVNGVPAWAARGLPRQCVFDRFDPRCQPPPAPQRLGDLQAFVRELALRYPSLVAIEVFNEPNLGVYNWQPQADPEYFVQVLRAANDGVDQVRPELPVLSGGIGPPGVPVPEGSMGPGEFLERMYAAGAHGAMDGIALHPYPAGTSPERPDASVYHQVMAEARAIRDRHGDGALPIWITEVGYTTTGPFSVTLDQQARWLPAIVDEAFDQSDIAAVVVHTLRDGLGGADDPETGYGLLHGDLSSKPVFDALARTVSSEHAERRGTSVRKGKSTRLRCRRVRRPARRRSQRIRRRCTLVSQVTASRE